jgi:SAM-dependent methyltransferase
MTGFTQLVVQGLAPVRRSLFRGSKNYWQDRYTQRGTSGAGSYGDVALFKAGFLNGFVKDNDVETVIEFGCGDGNQLNLAEYPSYLGLDVSEAAIALCRSRFAADPAKSFYLYSPNAFVDHARLFRADIALSLDVIYHLVEDQTFDLHMRHLLAAADRYAVIFSTNSEESDPAPHVRHRRFTDWIDAEAPGWSLVHREPNPHRGSASLADFYVLRAPETG